MKELEKLIMELKKLQFAKVFIPRERAPGTHCIGGWVGSRNGLDIVERRNILPLPVIQPHLSTTMPVETPRTRQL
jgi:hypothetical protein